jgi:glucose-1-phosphate thymidylyltransferase
MIIAGDNLFNFALKPSYDIFRAKKTNVNVLYDVADKKVARDFGIVKIDKSNKFIAFVEKPQNPDSTLASMGIMYFPKATIAKMKQYVKEGNDPDKVGCFFEWLIRKDTVYAHIHKEKWFDIGTFEGLGKARAEFAPSS